MNRIAFAFGATVDWRVKYTTVSHAGASATPAIEDTSVLHAILSESSSSTEDAILDAAIDWYNRGSTSRNPLVSFLCYYIALESVVIAITDGDADFGLGYSHVPRQQLRLDRAECIKALHSSLYRDEPLQFVQRAYFDCVVALTSRVRGVFERVFGLDHPYIFVLLEETSGESLASIRGKLAHGRVTSANREDEELVSGRLHELASISHEFLTRVIAGSRSEHPNQIPMWSQLHSLEVSMSDPRALLITSDLATIRRHDWTIRPEWCD